MKSYREKERTFAWVPARLRKIHRRVSSASRVTHAPRMQRCNDAFDLVHAFPRLLHKENYRGRARASCFVRRENEAGTGEDKDVNESSRADDAQQQQRRRGRLRFALIAPNLPAGFRGIYSGTDAI